MNKRILASLKGGDLRSIGEADEAVKKVEANPELFDDLFTGMLSGDRHISMRAADAVEKATRKHAEWLQPWKRLLLEQVSVSKDKELRWHVAQLLPRLTLTPLEKDRVVHILTGYLGDESSIVRTFSMQGLADLARGDEQLRNKVRPLIERLTRTGTPAMKSRGRKLLKQLSEQQQNE